MQAETLPYYSFDKVMSYNIPWNIVCGARGLGKTYGCTRDAVRAFTRTGEQFIYLRRHQNEIDEAKSAFFDSIGDEFDDWDFKVHGKFGYASRVEDREVEAREWHKVVHFIALSSAQSLKSKDYRFVTRIIFDEFIIEKGYTQYIDGPNEPRILQNFYNTVDRYKNKTKLFMLSNSVTMMNPYYLRYKFDPTEAKEFTVVGRSKFLLVHLVEADAFESAVRNSEFGKFIEEFDPDYADYAMSNKHSDAHGVMVGPKTKTAKHRFNLETKQGTFSIWKDALSGPYYATAQLPKRGVTFTFIPENVSNEKSLAIKSDKFIASLRTAWRTGNMLFDSPATRNMFTEVFK